MLPCGLGRRHTAYPLVLYCINGVSSKSRPGNTNDDLGFLTPLSAIFQLYHWRPVLVVEEAGVPRENHRPWASNWLTLSLAAASRLHPFRNLQSRTRPHVVLVIGLNELLVNPTT